MSDPKKTPELAGDSTERELAAPIGCMSCGAPAVLKNEDGEYCKDCMQIHLVEKMFVNLTALQGKRP